LEQVVLQILVVVEVVQQKEVIQVQIQVLEDRQQQLVVVAVELILLHQGMVYQEDQLVVVELMQLVLHQVTLPQQHQHKEIMVALALLPDQVLVPVAEVVQEQLEQMHFLEVQVLRVGQVVMVLEQKLIQQ
jgi:hypothetical protein